ncbi:MAG: DUF1844 domain-containing protein [Phycisphaerae bacterium]|nr:DUF1844 domain-containing protein [Phycisphaerae bacterium]
MSVQSDSPDQPSATPKLHIDSDWKAQAHAEKERLAKMEIERERERAARPPQGAQGAQGARGLGPGGAGSAPGARREATSGAGPEGDAQAGAEEEMPPADFKSLMGILASQAMMGLGAYGDENGRVVVDLIGARFAIDLLGVLEEKTKGNLTTEEVRDLTDILGQLSSRFMQIATLVAQQVQKGAVAGPGGGAMLGGPQMGGPGMGGPGMGGPGMGLAGSGPAPRRPIIET